MIEFEYCLLGLYMAQSPENNKTTIPTLCEYELPRPTIQFSELET